MLNFTPFPIIKTERLVLRQLKQEDAALLYDYMSNKEHFPYVEMPIYTQISQAENYIEKMNQGVQKNQWIIWAITLNDTIIGTLSIWNCNSETLTAELGYGLFPSFRGKGYMNEALVAGQKYAFDTMNLKTIEAYTSVDNKSSRNLLEKLSFEYTETIEDEYQDMKLMAIYKKNKS